jgi:predicted small secreted protein
MKTTFKPVVISLVLILLGIMSLSGCQNTVSGIGKDMQANGKEIQKSVNEH